MKKCIILIGLTIILLLVTSKISFEYGYKSGQQDCHGTWLKYELRKISKINAL